MSNATFVQMFNAKEANEKHKLTNEELKTFPGFESIENTDAEVVINNLYHLSLLFYEYYKLNVND